MSQKKLYVGNLAYHIGSEALVEIFSRYGKVESANVVINKFNNKSKGYGFVEMSSEEEAKACIDDLHARILEDRVITVTIAKEPVAKKTETKKAEAAPSESPKAEAEAPQEN